MMSLNANDPLRFYLLELSTVRPLTRDEETDLLRHVRNQDELAESASKRLIEANLSLVVSTAEQHSSAGINMLDLVQEGNAALLVALQTFTEGDSFSAHAAACVEDAILKAIAESRSEQG